MRETQRRDIRAEAEKLAARINGTERTQGGRRFVGAQRVVMWLDGGVSTYGADTHTGRYMLKHKAHRLVGVYTPGVTVDQVAEDLAEVMS